MDIYIRFLNPTQSPALEMRRFCQPFIAFNLLTHFPRCGPVRAKATLLRMRITLPRLLSLLFLLPLTLVPAIAQDWAKARLEKSPRHREYVTLKHDARSLQALVVYPEVNTKAPVVVMIHEIFGLSDWAKEMADELAGQGFIVIAPDLLSGHGPNGGGSDAIPSQDDRVKAVSVLDANEVLADLDAAADYGKKLPAANGELAVAGFCWGGGKSFAFATHRRDLSAAFVFYGPGPADVSTITAPVYGFYAGSDARIGATVPATTAAMKAAGKFYEPVTYDGAGHGFMRAGEDPGDSNPANKTAREQAFARLVKLLKDMKPAHAANASFSGLTLAMKSPPCMRDCHDVSLLAARVQ
jgi:carboxymethylenebutenolidase